jgi:hypothetical protein
MYVDYLVLLQIKYHVTCHSKRGNNRDSDRTSGAIQLWTLYHFVFHIAVYYHSAMEVTDRLSPQGKSGHDSVWSIDDEHHAKRPRQQMALSVSEGIALERQSLEKQLNLLRLMSKLLKKDVLKEET